jgi:hypothetical protein
VDVKIAQLRRQQETIKSQLAFFGIDENIVKEDKDGGGEEDVSEKDEGGAKKEEPAMVVEEVAPEKPHDEEEAEGAIEVKQDDEEAPLRKDSDATSGPEGEESLTDKNSNYQMCKLTV